MARRYNPLVKPPTLTLSSEVADLKRSVMRDLLSLAVDPGIVSLAGGLPASELLPTNDLRACIDAVIERDGPRALQYSPAWEPLKEWIAKYMQGQRRRLPARRGLPHQRGATGYGAAIAAAARSRANGGHRTGDLHRRPASDGRARRRRAPAADRPIHRGRYGRPRRGVAAGAAAEADHPDPRLPQPAGGEL